MSLRNPDPLALPLHAALRIVALTASAWRVLPASPREVAHSKTTAPRALRPCARSSKACGAMTFTLTDRPR
ncbi:hypothetical protein AB4Z46_30680 [Variovorax sp. M-6]|uniref:hypothetical protein n=1 Tax=Variovorax sp. M-6 TaxID=3233041 RepID=UPI003F9D1095